MELRFLKGNWGFGKFKLQYRSFDNDYDPQGEWKDVPIEDSQVKPCGCYGEDGFRCPRHMGEEKIMDESVLARESRALFMKWVKTLNDDDIDKILGIEPKTKEIGLREKLAEKMFNTAYDTVKWPESSNPEWWLRLAEIAIRTIKEHEGE